LWTAVKTVQICSIVNIDIHAKNIRVILIMYPDTNNTFCRLCYNLLLQPRVVYVYMKLCMKRDIMTQILIIDVIFESY